MLNSLQISLPVNGSNVSAVNSTDNTALPTVNVLRCRQTRLNSGETEMDSFRIIYTESCSLLNSGVSKKSDFNLE